LYGIEIIRCLVVVVVVVAVSPPAGFPDHPHRGS